MIKAEQKTKVEQKECSICIMKITKCKREFIKCSYCNFECCKLCIKTFILTKSQPQCIKCNAIWSDEFLEQYLEISWIKEKLRNHLDNVIFEQEKSMLAIASHEIFTRRIRNEREYLQQEFNIMNNFIDRIKNKIEIYKRNLTILTGKYENASTRIKQLMILDINIQDKLIVDINLVLETKEKILENLINKIEKFNQENNENVNILSSISIRCLKDKCVGFLSNKYKCMVCEYEFCKDCYVNLTDELKNNITSHVCDNDLVKTLKLIEKNSKPCPNCKISIEKIEGCNQMWCINCNTGFNWATGEIEKGRIHNPHYFEWVNRTGGVDNNLTGGNADCRITINDIKTICINRQIQTKVLLDVLRLIIHFEETYLARNLPEYSQRHLETRIEFILSEGKISEELFKNKLSINEKKYKLSYKIRQLIETLRTVLSDILNRFRHDKNYITYIDDIFAIIDYFNNCSKKISIYNNNRTYVGIIKSTFTENSNIPIVDIESPFNYVEVLSKLT